MPSAENFTKTAMRKSKIYRKYGFSVYMPLKKRERETDRQTERERDGFYIRLISFNLSK